MSTGTGPQSRIPSAHRVSWLMLAVTTGAILITSIDRVILPTVLPAIVKEFHLTETQGGFLVSLSFLGSALGGVILGTLGDSFGRGPRRAYMWGVSVLISLVGAVGTAVSATLVQLQALRIVMGLGTGSMEPINVAMISEWWQREDRGFAVGFHHIGFPLGQFAGPLLIGLILVGSTWRSAFLLIPLIAVPIVIGQALLAKRTNLRRVNEWIRDHQLTPSVETDEVETETVTNPVDEIKRALAYRNVRLAIVMNFLFLFAELGIASFLTTQLTGIGISLAAAATISGASGITGWVGQIFWGRVSDYRGRKFSMAILSVGLTVTTLAMIFINSAAMGWAILIGWGVFRNSPYPVLYSSVVDTVPEAASSGMGLMIGVGLGVAGLVVSPIAGYVIQHYGFTVDYTILAAAYLLTLVPIVLMTETAGERGETVSTGVSDQAESV